MEIHGLVHRGHRPIERGLQGEKEPRDVVTKPTASSLVHRLPSFIRPPRKVIRMVTKQFSRRKFEDKGHFDELYTFAGASVFDSEI